MENCNNTFNSICRVCLKLDKIESMVSLREKPGRRSLVTFGKVLVKLTRISIDYDDFLPTKICQNCMKMIQNINSFNLMCKNNDRKLRKFVNIAQNDSEKCKNMICEYTLFSQYFPAGTFKNHVSPSIKLQNSREQENEQESPLVCLKSKSFPVTCNNDSDNDYSYNSPLEEDSTKLKDEGENVDLFLDSIENALSNMDHQIPNESIELNENLDTQITNETTETSQAKQPQILNIDKFLDSLEEVVTTKTQCIKTKTKPLKHTVLLTTEKVEPSQAKPWKQPQDFHIDKFLDTLEEAVTIKSKRIKIKTKRIPPQHIAKNFHCDICNRTLASQTSYNYHMQRHTKYRYICDQCGRGFPCKVPLHRHMVINHDKGPFLRCNHCDFKCSRRYDLVEHIRVHTGERPFTCEKCGLTFRRRAIWKSHLIQHQEKNIPCPVCQKMFHRQCDVNWHINSAHVRTYFYLCSVCNASYATNKTVRKHMLSKHGIPREKQGKITRVTKDSSSIVFNDNNMPVMGYSGV